ncbi:MAG: Gfo/Idh/MocA family oxidoreductase [Salinibacterium sp.]|nr:Gfo/Idh/MocA family oxidoreductase [Salinibacterium sp.]
MADVGQGQFLEAPKTGLKRIRIGVVGTGWWSTAVHMPALATDPRVELVAVVDTDQARARSAADQFGVASVFRDLDSMVATVPVHGVIIATPHHTHAELASRALEAGISALVEKPLATTSVDAWALVEAERRSAGTLVAGLTYQFAACAPFVREAVQERIGEVVSINAEFSSNTERLFSSPEDNSSDPGVAHGATYSDPSTGGGQGYTQLSHLLGGMLWALGDQATQVHAFMHNRSARVDIVDALSIRLAGGALAVASSTGTTAANVPVRHRIRFHGTAGMLEWDLLGAEAWLYQSDGYARHVENPSNRAPYASREVASTFARVIAGEVPNPAPAGAAAAGVALIEAAYSSAATQQRVEVVQGELSR